MLKYIIWLTALTLSIILVCTSNYTLAQRKRGGEGGGRFQYTIGGGWGISNVEAQGANFALKRYSENTGAVWNNEINQMNGFSVAMAFYGNSEKSGARSFYEIRFTNRGQNVSTNEIALLGKRELQFQLNQLSLGFGGLPISSPAFDLGLGFSIDGAWHDTSLKASTKKIPTQLTASLTGKMPMYINFAINSPVTLCIRPYYQFHFLNSDFSALNESLNPLTYALDDKKNLSSRLNNFGIDVQLLFVLHRVRYR